MKRKIPCRSMNVSVYRCQECGGIFSRIDALQRHVRIYCEAKQTLDQTCIQELKEQMKSIESTIKQLSISRPITINALSQTVVLTPWCSLRPIPIKASNMLLAFTKNAKLIKYASMTDAEMADPKTAGPYVLELFLDQIKRAHESPASRNIHLDPQRSDRVLVYTDRDLWDSIQIDSATCFMFDGIAEDITQMILDPTPDVQLPNHIKNAMAIATMVYREEPAKYAAQARNLLINHLSY